MRIEATTIERARAIPIEQELARRGHQLRRAGAERMGPCPVCGGRDRFSVNLRKQIFNCRGCGRGGDVIDLVAHLDGTGFAEAVRTLTGERAATARPIQRPSVVPAVETVDDRQTRRMAAQLWREAVPIEATLAERYLVGRPIGRDGPRGLALPDDVSPRVLRYNARCPYAGEQRPCLLALYRRIDGDHPVAIHRTALGPDATRLGRRALGPTADAAIKLTPDEDVTYGLSVGEGLETTLAGMALGFQPAWALGSSGAIRKFPVLAGIECLTILVDNDLPDPKGRRAGPQAAAECSERWTAAGREVRRVVPRRPGADMADLS